VSGKEDILMNGKYGASTLAALALSVLACSSDKDTPSGAQPFDSSVSGAVTGDAGATATPGMGGTTSGGMAGGGMTGATAGGGTMDAGAVVVDSGTTMGLPDTGVIADAGDAGASTDAAAGGPFAACVSALKPVCNYDEKETSCAVIKTPTIPLTDGTKWGDTELKQGPYGSYVEWNEGKAFANPVNIGEDTCEILAPVAFMEPDAVTQDVLNLRGQDLSLYTVFRPACFKDGEKYPVITWGNGTCGQSGGYAGLLATLASHGFVVFAANSRFTDGGNNEMLKALDLAKAANEDPMNPLFGKLDLTKVGAMGHSQGASATAHAAPDPRIKAFILWNGAVGGGPAINKPFIAISGERDIGDTTAQSLAMSISAATQPAAWIYYHKVLTTGGLFTGHLTLMMQPERVWEPTVAWWKYILNGDAEAKKMFAGSDCGLCNKTADFEYGQKNIQ
jgi:hypothetical protein